MTTSTKRPARTRILLIVVGILVATATGLLTAPPVTAANGPQPAPTLAPSPVPTAADDFTLGTGSCDGTGGAGWRVQTFIVNAGVDVGTLAFDQGGSFDRVGTDRDNSNGSIASPLWKGDAPATGFVPAASPAGLINPVDLTAFDFSNSGWTLTDGQYQIGYACLDELSVLRQWWSLPVTIDVDASPAAFMTVFEGTPEPTTTSVALAAAPTSSTVGTEVTFSATVSPSGAAGEVEFFVGGASQATDAVTGGVATWTTSALTAGTKSVTATFTPSDAAAFAASTSPVLSFVVSGPSALSTSVALTADPESPGVGQPVTLTATVTPAAAEGTIRFLDDGEEIGAAVEVTDGVATLSTSELPEGTHPVVAAFTPADAAAYQPSESAVLSLVVGTPTPSTSVPDPLAPGPGDGSTDLGTDGFTDVSGSGTLPATGMGLGAVGLGLMLVYVGRVAYLLGRPHLPLARRWP